MYRYSVIVDVVNPFHKEICIVMTFYPVGALHCISRLIESLVEAVLNLRGQPEDIYQSSDRSIDGSYNGAQFLDRGIGAGTHFHQ